MLDSNDVDWQIKEFIINKLRLKVNVEYGDSYTSSYITITLMLGDEVISSEGYSI